MSFISRAWSVGKAVGALALHNSIPEIIAFDMISYAYEDILRRRIGGILQGGSKENIFKVN